MRIEPAFVGARLIDSLSLSESGTEEEATKLASSGIDGVFGYLGVITSARVQALLAAGLAFVPVTLGVRPEQYDGVRTLAEVQALGLPLGAHVFLDVEGLSTLADFAKTDLSIRKWGAPIKTAGYELGGYLGNPQPFTSEELWELPFNAYWKGQGSCRDRHGVLAEPLKCGWSCTQMYPSRTWAGVLVDVDVVGQDYLGRTFNWVRA